MGTALTMIGIGSGLCWTPVLPSMIDTAANRIAADSDESVAMVTTKVSSAVAAIFNAAASVGEASGPTLGGAMVSNFGFDVTVIALGVLMWMTALSMKTL